MGFPILVRWHLYIESGPYQYRKSHCGDKTILRPSYLHNGISYTGKMTSLYWIRSQYAFIEAAQALSKQTAHILGLPIVSCSHLCSLNPMYMLLACLPLLLLLTRTHHNVLYKIKTLYIITSVVLSFVAREDVCVSSFWWNVHHWLHGKLSK